MKSNHKASIASRASTRLLVVACLPATVVAFVANSPALGAVYNTATNHGLSVDDNNGASTNGPGTNGIGSNTNGSREVPEKIAGQRL
jgi:hypothetical protein